jgi:hypothetical protein
LPTLKLCSGAKHYVLGDNAHYYVGYYDIDPISPCGDYVLCHKVSLKYTNYSEPEMGAIGLLPISTTDKQFIEMGDTRALNWQLGSRLQWFTDGTIIYNDIVDGKQCAILFNIVSKKIERYFKRPFWAISPDSKIAVSLNFSRLLKNRPGYGYAGESPDGDEDLLTIFDVATDIVLFQIDINSLFNQLNFNIPNKADPYFNHVTWSPCSTKFITLFLFEDPVSGKRFSYPVMVNCLDFSVSLFHADGLFSHHVWLDSESLLAFLQLNGENVFAVCDEKYGWKKTLKNMPVLDGHPSIAINSKDIIVDSYPDRLGRMFLYKGSSDNSKHLETLAVLMNFKPYSGAQRCDLHPRVSLKEKY